MINPYREWLGITVPPKDIDHYTLLGVRQFEDDIEAINIAALNRLAVIRTHQIGSNQDECTSLLRQITDAKAVLTDEAKKRANSRVAKPIQSHSHPLGEESRKPHRVTPHGLRLLHL